MKFSCFFYASRRISVIGCANGIGGRHAGCEKAVPVLKASKFLDKSGLQLEWKKIVHEMPGKRGISALPNILKVNRELASEVSKIIHKNEDLLVLGGDHSCAIGTWSGVASTLRNQGNIGLIWVDAHMDAHTPQTSDTGNIHGMPVAHLLGHGAKELINIGDNQPKVQPENLVLIGIRSFEKAERELLDELGAHIFYMEDIRRMGIHKVLREAIEISCRGTIGFGLSIDIDGFREEDAPGVGTPEDDGIEAEKFLQSVRELDLSSLIATEIVEFLPDFDDEHRTSEKLVAELIKAIYIRKMNRENRNVLEMSKIIR